VIKASKQRLALTLGIFIVIACIPLSGSISIILPYLSYFALGILLYFYRIKNTVSPPLFIAGCLFSLFQLVIFQGFAGAIAAALTICVILFWRQVNPVIKFFSTISYSLYLIHVPVGGKIINLGARVTTSEFSKYLLVCSALLVSISAAFAFYKFVELPAFRLSKRFRYDPNKESFEDKKVRQTEDSPIVTVTAS
jgi:peptidoglycan/LPS O-acetylase OafA/YrhL